MLSPSFDSFAADALVEESQEWQQSLAQSKPNLSQLVRAARQGLPVSQLVSEGGVVDFATARTYMTLLSQLDEHTVSLAAVAAGANTIQHRMVGEHSLRLEQDEDAVFLVLQLGRKALRVPKRLEVVGPDGRCLSFSLPSAIRGVVQLGLAWPSEEAKALRALFSQPQTLIQLA